jgi:hypothetical protein
LGKLSQMNPQLIFKINFNTVLPSMLRFCKWSHAFRLSELTFIIIHHEIIWNFFVKK